MVAQPDSILRLTHLRVLAGLMSPPTDQRHHCSRRVWWTLQRSHWPDCEPAHRQPRGQTSARLSRMLNACGGRKTRRVYWVHEKPPDLRTL